MPRKEKTPDVAKIEHLLGRNVEDVIDRAHLQSVLVSGKKLRVKFGIDPTGAKIHIGRAVALWKLREFQDLGHKVVLIIGDFTAQIGDPSDKLAKRPMLTATEIKKNLKNYLTQIGMILDLKKTEVRYNATWLKKLSYEEVLRLSDLFTAQQMIERRNFKDRWTNQQEISLREFQYPIMQGYDSVAVRADVELGGTDQLFNLLAGRKIQQHYGQKPQDIMTTRMLLGTDGRKMSTSWGNVINIADLPDEQHGKVMASQDDVIVDYFHAATDLSSQEIIAIERGLKAGENPKVAKERLAFEIVKRYHGEAAAQKAKERWQKVFSQKDLSVDLPELTLPSSASVSDLVMMAGAESKSKAWRLITQGSVSVAGNVKKDPREVLVGIKTGDLIKIGKRSFFRVKIRK